MLNDLNTKGEKISKEHLNIASTILSIPGLLFVFKEEITSLSYKYLS